MKMKKSSKVIITVFIMACMLLMTACSGGSAGKADAPTVKKYTWDEAEFTVKQVTDDESVVGSQADKVSGKCVAVVIDFGENTIAQDVFEGNVASGKFLLAGKKPTTYNYHMANMTLQAGGFVTQITGETVIFFDMDKDYVVNEEDLVITE
ncbi:MAG: hypothetical protein IKX76_03405 [Eubacterium sp.]|nr:hypothetical protein [Eubacterium sp.]